MRELLCFERSKKYFSLCVFGAGRANDNNSLIIIRFVHFNGLTEDRKESYCIHSISHSYSFMLSCSILFVSNRFASRTSCAILNIAKRFVSSTTSSSRLRSPNATDFQELSKRIDKVITTHDSQTLLKYNTDWTVCYLFHFTRQKKARKRFSLTL
jgi:hypothetical protein